MNAQYRSPWVMKILINRGSSSVTLRVTLLRKVMEWRVYKLMDPGLFGGRFVGCFIGGDHGSACSMGRVAFILAVSQLLAVITLEIWVSGWSGGGGLAITLLLLFTRGLGRVVLVLEVFEPEVKTVNLFDEAII